jgi:excisionase family DNA binding protein
MSLKDYAKTQLLEIIQWQEDFKDILSIRYPDLDKEIKRGAKLIVRESQMAQLVYQGQFGDTYKPGTYTLTTDNIPVLSTLKGWKYGFESPFKADVYFINTHLFTGKGWGTANPMLVRDADFGMVRISAYGTYDFRVVDPRLFLSEVAGTTAQFLVEDFTKTMRSRIVSVFSETLALAKLPALEIAAHFKELGDALLPPINQAVRSKYGLEIPTFLVENVSLPKEVEDAIDKRTSMTAIGNLNEYVKFQMAEGLNKGGGAGIINTAAQLGAGLTMGQQITGSMAGISDGGLLTPAEAANALKVQEADVLAALNEGSIKGKKIGSSWRITKQALDEFLKS